MEHLWNDLGAYLDTEGFSVRDPGELARGISLLAQGASNQLDASDRLGEVPW